MKPGIHIARKHVAADALTCARLVSTTFLFFMQKPKMPLELNNINKQTMVKLQLRLQNMKIQQHPCVEDIGLFYYMIILVIFLCV